MSEERGSGPGAPPGHVGSPNGPARRPIGPLPADEAAQTAADQAEAGVARGPRVGGPRRLLVFALLAAALMGAAIVGYRWWLDSTYFVSTDNAQIAGRLVQVGSLAAGRVASVQYDVGQRVARDQVVAQLYVPIPVGTTVNGQPRLEFRQTEDAQVDVRTPVSGVVVARNANPGDTVPAGQSLLTLVDPTQLWVNANVEETSIRRVQVGQPVTVHVDTLDADLAGRVAAITPASAATFSLVPQQNLSGNFTKVTQLVPVKIELDQPDQRLAMGTSVEVKIRVQQ